MSSTSDGGTWTDGTVTATLTADADEVVAGVDDLTLAWAVTVPPRGTVTSAGS